MTTGTVRGNLIEDGKRYVLAFDTSNETVAIGIGLADTASQTIRAMETMEIPAHRASNTLLLPHVDALARKAGITQAQIGCVAVGRGPGSFTGVRIAMAAAKGIACALGIPLVGVSTQEAIAWRAWIAGYRGRLLVISDAMRKEVYPAYFMLGEDGVERLTPDKVVKAERFVEELPSDDDSGEGPSPDKGLLVCGDALDKYLDLFESSGTVLPKDLWTATGEGLLMSLQALWQLGGLDIFDPRVFDPFYVLPIYTRLSDAEENERMRIADRHERDLRSGVQGNPQCQGNDGLGVGVDIAYAPFDAAYSGQAACMEGLCMKGDAWSEEMVTSDLSAPSRIWWMATLNGTLIGYAGAIVAGDDVQLLKIAVADEWRRHAVATRLLMHLIDDARNLAAATMSLEVRASNAGAIAFYKSLGFAQVGLRPNYYSDDDAMLLEAPLQSIVEAAEGKGVNVSSDIDTHRFTRVSGMDGPDASQEASKPILILAIESSCDETAASICNGEGDILSSVVSSQVEFHARFGGVVPEIASRKHIESIVSVCRMAFDEAADALGTRHLGYQDLSAVAVTFTPGLVGGLVVGVAFAKGVAWGAGIDLIGVNHLEGHLYANKLADGLIEPPLLASIVSGGNTMLVHVRDWGDYRVLGQTIDDAVGEAFDKVAKVLGLPYPGGPQISKLAETGDPHAVDFPRALMHSGDYRFSLSGLKTAVANYIEKERRSGRPLNIPDICASFQQAVIDVQVKKALRAIDETDVPTFCLGGGVAANPALRKAYEDACGKRGVKVVLPPLSACGDNAAMIALVAVDRFKDAKFEKLDLDACARCDLDIPY